jgi:CRP/FNR family transcriptional regulator
MPVDPAILRQAPLFSSLEQADLEEVAAVAAERHFGRGDIILLEGDVGGGLYFVRAGRVKIFRTSAEGKEQVLRLIPPGGTFNDVPALDGGMNPASAAAMEPCVVYAVGRQALRKLILERPGVAEAAIRTLSAALRHLLTVVESLSFRHVTARVAKILLDQEAASRQEGSKPQTPTGRLAHPYRLTQQEMAAMAGTAREVVGRALKELEAQGAIEMRQGHAVVVNVERLRLLT